ncbi:MAG: LacI family DNA-binding transcriptional regulator [Anaerolineaceae bacterium]|nr:LacI family DNA-binding transcriptional regulator [Anaerolineaceae bacterium]
MSTIADVAKLAGVSPGTVSRVMNGATNVNPDTRSKVEQAIAKLAYQPNFQARSLRSKRTDTIALAIPELTNYFWTTVARGVQEASQSNGYHVLICNTFARSPQNLRYLESIYSRVDGMILSRRSEWVVLGGDEGQVSREKPIVFVGQSQAAAWNVDNVYSDSISGAFALTEHLIRLGRQKIAIVTGRQSSTSASDRVAGYGMALAEAQIPLDPELICWGEYERQTAERLTHDLMERCPETTAIVAANNEIAIGVMHALEKRHIPVPEAVAVVCFDDFYPDSRFATLMTVASQSPYDIGVNAAQLLLNRLNSEDYLRPQTVVLPARLIVRQSCGGVPTEVEMNTAFDTTQGHLISPLPRARMMALTPSISPFVDVTITPKDVDLIQADKAQITLLKQALKRECSGCLTVPHFEYAITNSALYRYVLEREPQHEFIQQTSLICPEDQIEFAQRIGIAAVPCRFPFQPAIHPMDQGWAADGELPPFDFPSLTDQLDLFDRYIRIARSTNVGIAADFRSIFADTLNILDTLNGFRPDSQTNLLQKVASSLLAYQTKLVQLICDRFASDLAFVIFSDQLADENGPCLSQDEFAAVFSHRIKHLIRPARENGLSTVLYTPGKLDSLIPLISDLGFDAVYIAQPEVNDLAAIKQAAAGKLSFMGAIPVSLLMNSDEQTIIEQVASTTAMLAAENGYIAGVGAEVNNDIPVKNFFSLLRALSIARD